MRRPVELPVFVLSRDSGEMRKYQSLRELRQALERIDVENDEYECWDRGFRVVRLRVVPGEDWLELEASEPSRAGFRDALRRFASSAAVQPGGEPDESASAERMYEEISERVSADRRRAGWLARLIRRF